MDKLFKAIAKHFPDIGKWFAIVLTLFLGGHVLRLFGVPIEEYGRTISDRVFDFFETHFPEWPFLLLGLFVFGPFLGRTARKLALAILKPPISENDYVLVSTIAFFLLFFVFVLLFIL